MVEHDDGRGIRAVPPFVEAYTKITRKLGCLIVDLARFMTLSDIAGWLRLSWDTIKAVVKRRLEKDYRRIGYRRVRQIAIDELYLGRTRKYITLVMDMESARIISVGEGRGAEALREFWRRFKLSGARLKAVAMDMSGAYACSVRAHAPHAILTFDRFHVMKLMNERLDDLRREPYLDPRGRSSLASDQDRADAALSAWQILTRKWRTIPEGIALIAKETTPLGFWRRLVMESRSVHLPLQP